jgi:hypothetical protein
MLVSWRIEFMIDGEGHIEYQNRVEKMPSDAKIRIKHSAKMDKRRLYLVHATAYQPFFEDRPESLAL